jgi:hypothetical protein
MFDMLVLITDESIRKKIGIAKTESNAENRISVPTPPFLKYFCRRILSI